MENIFRSDIQGQPKVMAEAIARYRGYKEAYEKIAALNPQRVVFAGMGSSYFCSMPACIKLNQAGRNAAVITASELLYYQWELLNSDVVPVLISQSGESGEIVDILKKLPEDRLVIGITNDPESTLGKRANILLEMGVEPELSVSTRTYLASLVLVDVLAEVVLGNDAQKALDDNLQAAEALGKLLENQDALQDQIGQFLNHPLALCYIGRGPAVGTAEAAGLFTRETAKYPALGFDSAQFRHGPFEMVDENFGAVVFAPKGTTCALQIGLAGDIAARGGKAILVTDEDCAVDSPNVLVIRHPSVSEFHAPLVQIAVAQLLANDLALFRGFQPWVFRAASKITVKQ